MILADKTIPVSAIIVFSIALLIISSAQVHSQPSAANRFEQGLPGKKNILPGRSCDLGELLDIALSNNPKTRAAWFRAGSAAATIGEAEAAYYPKLVARLDAGIDKWYTPAANAPDNFRRKQVTALLAVEYLLLDFGRRSADVRKTVAMFEAAGLLYRRDVQEVTFRVQLEFFRHEAANGRRRSALSLLESAGVALQTIQKEVDAGLASPPELLAAKKRLMEAEFAVAESRSEVLDALGAVRIAVGLPADFHLEITESAPPDSSRKLRENVSTLIRAAVEERPDLAAKASELEASFAEIDRARADFLPEVRIEGSYGVTAFDYQASAGKTEGRYRENLGGYGLFLVAEWDIFDGFQRVAKLRKSKSQADAARENLEDIRLSASRDVWEAFNQGTAAAARTDFAESFVTSAREDFDAARQAFAAGLISAQELADASSGLAQAEAVRATAIAEYSISMASLAYAIGATGPGNFDLGTPSQNMR
jgi:outer membrane protein